MARVTPGVPAAPVARALVRRCIDAIEEGEQFQANMCTWLRGEFHGAPGELFGSGVRLRSARRSAYLAGQWGAVVSFSPELFLARHGDRVRSTPIKGTLPRRGSGDDANAARLRRSDKDVAENVMITDLVRYDLGRVSKVGSVTVTELLAVRPAPGVWHLESTVESRLADGLGDADLLRATFPPGSVTGAPKVRALELIDELEAEPRGVYTGAVGMASPIAGLELNVAIRTFELSPRAAGRYTIELGVGGGITALSDPALEWQECLHKAAPLEALLAGGSRQRGGPQPVTTISAVS
jgi:para-aminobenzoate synthetase component I